MSIHPTRARRRRAAARGEAGRATPLQAQACACGVTVGHAGVGLEGPKTGLSGSGAGQGEEDFRNGRPRRCLGDALDVAPEVAGRLP
ncbi:MAG: hypothetical protein ACOVOX_12190 [Burkholderiaceae bacterium]